MPIYRRGFAIDKRAMARVLVRKETLSVEETSSISERPRRVV
jgi:hypothetical protein